MRILTKRLEITPATDEEMRELIARTQDDGLKAAYGEMLSGGLAHPAERLWYVAWLIRAQGGKTVGDLCFKGLSPDGKIEIGYGIDEESRNRGYATEAVNAVCDWAERQPGVREVEAEAEETNLASLRVLEKTGFARNGVLGEEGPRFVRKKQARVPAKAPCGEPIRFRTLRPLISRIDRVSICDAETGNYQTYRRIDDVPHDADERTVRGFGLAKAEFADGEDLTLLDCIEVVLNGLPE